jgi:circadian clock protein KaiC
MLLADVNEVRPARIIIDSISALENRTEQQAFRDFVVGFSAEMKARGIATMMITTPPELMGASSPSGVDVSTLTDGIILLRYVEIDGDLRRAIMVLKLRGTGHARELCEYDIGNGGMRILGPLRGQQGLLGGPGRRTGSADPRGPDGWDHAAPTHADVIDG